MLPIFGGWAVVWRWRAYNGARGRESREEDYDMRVLVGRRGRGRRRTREGRGAEQ